MAIIDNFNRRVIIERGGQKFLVKVTYSLGGMNYFTYKNEPRGYWLHVQPVEIEEKENGVQVMRMTAFTGVKKFLLEVKRKSKKQEEQAFSMVTDELVNDMIEQCKF